MWVFLLLLGQSFQEYSKFTTKQKAKKSRHWLKNKVSRYDALHKAIVVTQTHMHKEMYKSNSISRRNKIKHISKLDTQHRQLRKGRKKNQYKTLIQLIAYREETGLLIDNTNTQITSD